VSHSYKGVREHVILFLLPLLAAKRFTTSLPTHNLIFCATVDVIRNSRAAEADATKCDETVEFRRVELCKLNRRQSARRLPTVADCRRHNSHIYRRREETRLFGRGGVGDAN